jgi:hypothetical protein
MPEEHEYRITGTHSDTGEPVTFTLHAEDQNEASAQAHNRGVQVEHIEYVGLASPQQGGRHFFSGGDLISIGVIFVVVALVIAILGSLASKSEGGQLFTLILGGVLNLVGGILLLAGIIRWAVSPLLLKLDEVRKAVEKREGDTP